MTSGNDLQHYSLDENAIQLQNMFYLQSSGRIMLGSALIVYEDRCSKKREADYFSDNLHRIRTQCHENLASES